MQAAYDTPMHLTHQPRVRNLPAHRRGEDFLVSPINGHFNLLETRLAEAGFRADRDRVLAVGNVLGPAADWPGLLQWIGGRQIISVLGSQESALLEWANQGQGDARLLPAMSAFVLAGHRWVLGASPAALAEIIVRVREWPLVLRVTLPSRQTVGIVHGEVPPGRNWNSLHALFERPDAVTSVLHGARRPLAVARAAREHRAAPHNASVVPGIDHVVCAGRGVRVTAATGNIVCLPSLPNGTPRVVRLRSWLQESVSRCVP